VLVSKARNLRNLGIKSGSIQRPYCAGSYYFYSKNRH
jgi:hypothetical protein